MKHYLTLNNFLISLIIAKITFSPALTDSLLFLIVMLNAAYDRWLNYKSKDYHQTAVDEKVNTLTHQMHVLNEGLGTLKNKQAEDAKVISEAKTLLTASRLSAGMNRGIQ